MLDPQERIKMAAEELRERVSEYQEYIEILEKAHELKEKQDPKFKLGIDASERYVRALNLSKKIITSD